MPGSNVLSDPARPFLGFAKRQACLTPFLRFLFRGPAFIPVNSPRTSKSWPALRTSGMERMVLVFCVGCRRATEEGAYPSPRVAAWREPPSHKAGDTATPSTFGATYDR